jgi:hypothetical protein
LEIKKIIEKPFLDNSLGNDGDPLKNIKRDCKIFLYELSKIN